MNDGSESGHVSPINNCPHVDSSLSTLEKIDTAATCSNCKENKENWICLTCSSVGCSRFQGAHAKQHYETTQHPIALSFSDLSVWCYACESYIRNPKLSHSFQLAHEDKFLQKPGTAPTTFIISKSGNVNEEELKEYFDDPEEVKEKVKQLAQIILASKHIVVYTGAGVSTSAKIPDYRGPKGIWTLQEKGISPHFEVTLEQALPTLTHMALVELYKKDVIKFTCSTNVDGLHRRSGIPANGMSELHGNCYLEICSAKTCGKEYLRSFDASSGRNDHKTGRNCDLCKAPLLDSIINFGENLPVSHLERAQFEAGKSDVSLVLGTSMRVSPANKLPLQAVENGGKMVIVNLQKTPYDKKAFLLIRERTDKVIELLMEQLHLDIPQYSLSNDTVKNG